MSDIILTTCVNQFVVSYSKDIKDKSGEGLEKIKEVYNQITYENTKRKVIEMYNDYMGKEEVILENNENKIFRKNKKKKIIKYGSKEKSLWEKLWY
jgi:hypothetical protein